MGNALVTKYHNPSKRPFKNQCTIQIQIFPPLYLSPVSSQMDLSEYLDLKNGDGVVEHEHPEGELFTGLSGCRGGRSTAPVDAGRCRVTVRHLRAHAVVTLALVVMLVILVRAYAHLRGFIGWLDVFFIILCILDQLSRVRAFRALRYVVIWNRKKKNIFSTVKCIEYFWGIIKVRSWKLKSVNPIRLFINKLDPWSTVRSLDPLLSRNNSNSLSVDHSRKNPVNH